MELDDHVLTAAAHAILPGLVEGSTGALAGTAIAAAKAPIKRLTARIRSVWRDTPADQWTYERLKELLAQLAGDEATAMDLIVIAGCQIQTSHRDRYDIAGDAQINTGLGTQNVNTGSGSQENIGTSPAEGGHVEIGTQRG